MLEKLNYFPVNWVDGMKINKSHFIAMQDNFIDTVRDAIGSHVTPISYGLLPVQSSMKSVRLSLVIDNHKRLRVKIEECHAVTPNGTRIEISPMNNSIDMQAPYPEAVHDLEDGKEVVLLANIIANPFKKVPFGELDSEENPPRYPYLTPTYRLHLVPEDKESSQSSYIGYQLTVGKIIISKEKTDLQPGYIPPCTTTNSHESLIDMHTRIDKFMGQLEVYAVQIAQKINRKQQTNDLAVMVLKLSELIITYLGNEINSLRWFGLYTSPAYMFDKIVRLARITKNFVDAKSGAGKEELLNYLAEWCGLSQGDFEVLFTNLVNVEYNHSQIDKTLKQVNAFMLTIDQLFSSLNKLDYIGRRNDTGIFVKERQENEPIEKPRSRLFFDD
jgi:predicted component of type VI protein secretion system